MNKKGQSSEFIFIFLIVVVLLVFMIIDIMNNKDQYNSEKHDCIDNTTLHDLEFDMVDQLNSYVCDKDEYSIYYSCFRCNKWKQKEEDNVSNKEITNSNLNGNSALIESNLVSQEYKQQILRNYGVCEQ